jgi:hypothetical protein
MMIIDVIDGELLAPENAQPRPLPLKGRKIELPGRARASRSCRKKARAEISGV